LHFAVAQNYVYYTMNTIQISTIMHKQLGIQYTTAQCQLIIGFTKELRHLFN